MFTLRRESFNAWCLPLLLVAVACGQCAAWLWFSGRQLESLGFDRARGRIVAISAEKSRTAFVTVNRSSSPARELNVRYRYQVEGKKYEGDRHRIAYWPLSRSQADRYVRDHPPGSIAQVYYDPHDPSRAVLVQGLEGSDLLFLQVVMVFCLGAVFACAVARRGIVRHGDLTGIPFRQRPSGPRWGPLGALGLSLIVTGMMPLGYFALIRNDFGPSLETMVWIWCINLTIGVAFYVRAKFRVEISGTEVENNDSRPL